MFSRKFISIFIIVLLLCFPLFAQTTFIKTYGDSLHRDSGYDILKTNDGNYAVIGMSNNDYSLLKINPDGDRLWSKTYGGSSEDKAYSFVETTENGFLLTGYSQSHGGMWLVRTDMNGDSLWTKAYPGFGKGNSICSTQDSCFIITGKYIDDVYAMKIDENGDSLWAHTYDNGNADGDEGKDIISASDSGYIILCSPGVDQIKIDENGNRLWKRTHDYTTTKISAFQGRSVLLTSDKGYIITGSCTYTDPAIGLLVYGLIIKTNILGDTLWTQTIGSVHMQLSDAIELTNGEYIITGHGVDKYSSNESIPIIKLDYGGNILWRNHIGDEESYIHRAFAITQTDDIGFMVAGTKWSTLDLNKQDICIAKTDSSGQVLLTGIDEGIIQNFLLYQNYPNPFNPVTKIRYHLPIQAEISIVIYDIKGNIIREWYFYSQNSGTYELLWNGKDIHGNKVSSGIYIYSLSSENFIETKKMVLLK